jgi:hypothetical protein
VPDYEVGVKLAVDDPSGAKVRILVGLNGTAEEAAEKVEKGRKSSPQALKRDTFSATHGTTEVVPFPKPCVNQSFSASCEAAPYPKPVRSLR